MAAAEAVDAKSAGERLPWEGVPIALKDILCVRGMETTAGSRILRGYVPPYDATVVAMLRDAGVIFLGKLIFRFLGITVGDFMVAGGAVLFCIAILDILGPQTHDGDSRVHVPSPVLGPEPRPSRPV